MRDLLSQRHGVLGSKTHLLFSAMVLHKDSMADHNITKSCNGQRHQSVPGSEQHHSEGVQQAEAGGAQDAPGRLEEGGVNAGDHVDSTVADDQEVESGSLLSMDAESGPQVDCEGDHRD